MPASARILNIAHDTSKKWACGKNPFNPNAINELNDYLKEAEACAVGIFEAVKNDNPAPLEYYNSDTAAIDAGFPSKGAHDQILARAVYLLHEADPDKEIEFKS